MAGERSDQRACERPDGQPDRPVELRGEDLHKSFDENHVLHGVDLKIRRAEIVAVVGGSGCGKTVLLELMTGQMTPDRGRVLVANHEKQGAPLEDLSALSEEEMDDIRIHWSIVFQRNALFGGTVYENIALWLREVRNVDERRILERARTAVEAVGLDPDTVLEEHRDDLSGGMAKRVAIARALAMDPILIFYDEPTTGLDPQHAARIHDLVFRSHWEPGGDGLPRTSVVITHDKELLRRLEPRVVMLHEGRIFFDGDYRAFARSPSPVVRPYFDEMPVLQRGRRR